MCCVVALVLCGLPPHRSTPSKSSCPTRISFVSRGCCNATSSKRLAPTNTCWCPNKSFAASALSVAVFMLGTRFVPQPPSPSLHASTHPHTRTHLLTAAALVNVATHAQEDAHEFCRELLNSMHQSHLRTAGLNPRSPPGRIGETTFIHHTFGGYLRSQVRRVFFVCDVMGFSSVLLLLVAAVVVVVVEWHFGSTQGGHTNMVLACVRACPCSCVAVVMWVPPGGVSKVQVQVEHVRPLPGPVARTAPRRKLGGARVQKIHCPRTAAQGRGVEMCSMQPCCAGDETTDGVAGAFFVAPYCRLLLVVFILSLFSFFLCFCSL